MALDLNAPAKTVSQFHDSITRLARRNHDLLRRMGEQARQDSVQFLTLRLDRTGQAMEKLQNCQGLGGVIAVQQGWLRDLVQDYAEHNLRLAGIFRGIAHDTLASARDAAGQTLDQARETAAEAQQSTSEAVHQAESFSQDMANQAPHYAQENQSYN